MVEVFRTNVSECTDAARLTMLLQQHLPLARITFDLEDCDRVLRVEDTGVEVNHITRLLTEWGYCCEVLE